MLMVFVPVKSVFTKNSKLLKKQQRENDTNNKVFEQISAPSVRSGDIDSSDLSFTYAADMKHLRSK